MMRTIFALAVALFASSLFAEEEIYLYTSYNNNEGTRVSHKMKCRDSLCMVKNNSTEQPVSLSGKQRDQILDAYQAEVKRFDIKSTPKAGDRLVKIKFKYFTDGKRLDITQRIPVEHLSDVSPELIVVIETYFAGLDYSSLGATRPATSTEKSAAPAR